MADFLTIAIPTGRLGKQTLKRFNMAGMLENYEKGSRKLILIDGQYRLRFLFVKPVDVMTYVTNKVADIGVVGKDQILEEQANIYEIMDLKFGQCMLAIAGFDHTPLSKQNGVLSIATKYPHYTERFFLERNQQVNIIPLNGSVELAPLVGLADVIVDIVETGATLKENGLKVLQEMIPISARLIANRVSYRFKIQAIEQLIERLNKGVGVGNETNR